MSEVKRPKKDRHWLVYRESIRTEMRPGAASKAVTEYLQAIGYRQTQVSPSMQFERGSLLAGLYSPNPRRQQTRITVDVVGGGNGQRIIEVVMRVNRAGNVPLRKDYEFWRAELDGLANSLHYGYADPHLSEYAAESAKWYNVTVMLAVLFAVVLTLLLTLGAAVMLAGW